MNRVVVLFYFFVLVFLLQAGHMIENKSRNGTIIIPTACYDNCIAIMDHGNTLLWLKFIFKMILWYAYTFTVLLNNGIEPESVKKN